jgi:2-furoyl-CoA dehydrogenase large subunit
MAVGAALFERFVSGDDGDFLTGSLADYAVPTAYDIPVGAKGVEEGNSMSTPV